MADREKVINGLEEAKEYIRTRSNGSASKICRLMDVCNAAVILLKEQEAVKPKCKERMGGFVAGLCPTCGTALNNVLNVKACGKCGQAVKWDD